MNKDQMAVYLSEHLEFFNDYPELLGKIKSIDEKGLPIRPSNRLSLADRLIKRVQDDKDHLKSKLEFFVEVTRTNEEIHQHLFEIFSERTVWAAMLRFQDRRVNCGPLSH